MARRSGSTVEGGTATHGHEAPVGRPDPPPARNEVLLVGRVAAAAEERELPSGDVLAAFRVVVDRVPPLRPSPGRPVGVDTLDCTAWGAGVRRTARSLGPGDVVQVQGALRRRFWRGPTGATSRTEVEVSAVRRLVRAPVAPVRAPRRRAPEGGAPPAPAVDEQAQPAEAS